MMQADDDEGECEICGTLKPKSELKRSGLGMVLCEECWKEIDEEITGENQ